MRLIFLVCAFLLSNMAFAASTQPFSLTSSAVADQGVIPVLYTCDGKDFSPPLKWAGVPEKTAAFALVVSDPDAPAGVFYHWLVFNIPKAVSQLNENASLPSGSMTVKNSFGKNQYNGPCPPKGSSHHYIFTLYALDNLLTLSNDAESQTVIAEIKKHRLLEVKLTATYSRWGK